MKTKVGQRRFIVSCILLLTILTTVLCCTFPSRPAFAEGTAEYTITTQDSYLTNYTGDVSVVINVKNSSGKAYYGVSFDMSFDASAFTFVKENSEVGPDLVDNDIVLVGNEVTVVANNLKPANEIKKPDIYIAKLVFKVKSGAVAKDCDFTFSNYKTAAMDSGNVSEITSVFNNKKVALKAPLSGADLTGIVIQGMAGSWTTGSGSASGSVYSATAEVPFTTTTARMTPTVSPGATVKVNNAAVASGQLSVAVNLTVGTTSIPIVVVAQDGKATKSFTVKITRKAGNDDTALSLTVKNSEETILDFSTEGQILQLKEEILFAAKDGISIVPTVNATSTLTVNGTVAVSGAATLLTLNAGKNEIAIIVTSQSGKTKDYTLVVNVKSPKVANTLSELKLFDKDGVAIELTPVFSPDILMYFARVDAKATTINVTAVASDASSTIASGVGEHLLSKLSGILSVVVEAQNGETKVYQIAIIQMPVSAENDLKDVVINGNKLNFSPDQLTYDINISGNQSTVDVSYFAGENLKVEVFGNTNLVAGRNVVLISVQRPDGTKTVYTINVYKADSAKLGYLILSIVLALLLVASIAVIVIVKKKYKETVKKCTPPDPEEKNKELDGAPKSDNGSLENGAAKPTQATPFVPPSADILAASSLKVTDGIDVSSEKTSAIPKDDTLKEDSFTSDGKEKIQTGLPKRSAASTEIDTTPKDGIFAADEEEKSRTSFQNRLMTASEDIKTKYNDLKNLILSYSCVTVKQSTNCDNFRFKIRSIAKINVVGEAIKLTLAMKNTREAATSQKADKELSFVVTIKAESSIDNALELVEKMMQSFEIVKNEDYVRKDYKAEIEICPNAILVKKGKENLIQRSVDIATANQLIEDNEVSFLIETEMDTAAQAKVIQSADVYLENVAAAFENNSIITLRSLKEKGLIKENTNFVKIQARSQLSKSFSIFAHDFSPSAVKMIAISGGCATKLQSN